jgi:succinate dehydrogenase/fumarate reductase flavoprotein subunit
MGRLAGEGKSSRRLGEARSLCMVANAILQSALARTESRGAHYRSDYPRRDDENFGRHSIFGREQQVIFEMW